MCELLEALKVGLGFAGLALPAQRTGEPELRGDIHRIKFHCASKFFFRFWVLLLLRVNVAQEIVRIGVVGSEFRGLTEVGDGLLGLSVIAMQQAQVVRHRRILRIQSGSTLQNLFRLSSPRKVEQRDPKIELCGGVVLVGRKGLLKLL